MRKRLVLGISNDIKNLLHTNRQALHVQSGFEDIVKSGGYGFSFRLFIYIHYLFYYV